jgi:hypothetical protein
MGNATKQLHWYEYRQNNSGGSFHMNDDVSVYVLVEAEDDVQAEREALEAGIYFDGVAAGFDCSCCGDRWYEGEKLEEFRIYQLFSDEHTLYDDVGAYAAELARESSWAKEGRPVVVVYHKNGKVERFYK